MSELAPPTAPDAIAEPVRFGPAVVAVFVSRAIGGTLVALFWSMLPLYGHPYAYGGWSRYVIGYSLAASVVGAFFIRFSCGCSDTKSRTVPLWSHSS